MKSFVFPYTFTPEYVLTIEPSEFETRSSEANAFFSHSIANSIAS